MANPSYVNSGSDAGGGGDTFSNTKAISVPAGASAGMLMEITAEHWTSGAEPTVTNWAGFQEVALAHATIVTTGTPGNQSIRKAWKRLTAGDISTGTFTVTYSGTCWNKLNAMLGQNVASSGDPVDVANTATGTTGYPNAAVTTSGPALLSNSAGTFQAVTSTPPGGYTERQDADVLRLNTQEVSVAGAVPGSGGTVSGNGEICVATVAYKGDAAVSDAGLWTPPFRDLLIPDSLLFFPFQAQTWAGDPVAGATGIGQVIVRTATSSTGLRSTTGSAASAQRSATTESGQKSAAGVLLSVGRTQTQETGTKQATGVAVGGARCATSCAGQKGVSSTPQTPQRSQVSEAGLKQATGSGSSPVRSLTVAGSSVGGAGRTAQRSVTSATGVRGAVGTGTTVSRATGAAVGQKGGQAVGGSVARCTSSGAGRKGGVAAGASIARPTGLSAGKRSGAGGGATTCRVSSGGTSQRAASGAGVSSCRAVSVAAGSSTPIPSRDLTLTGSLAPGRFSGTIAPGRFSGVLAPGRFKGKVIW